MSFKSFPDRLLESDARREKLKRTLLTYGIEYLDKALLGITYHDLVLVGAPTGSGKTNFIANLALANVRKGKRVHLMALEAHEGEVEDRLFYSAIAQEFYRDPERPKNIHLRYVDWCQGNLDHLLDKYKKSVLMELGRLEKFKTFYRGDSFDVEALKQNAFAIAHETDLIIVDHVHYFDYRDDNENRALKEIVKSVREINQIIEKPIILVAHLRKKPNKNSPLVADNDEFMGSSDLTKIATTIISLGRGEMLSKGRSETFLRISKSRVAGEVIFYVAKLLFNLKTNTYDKAFKLGKLVKMGTQFEEIKPEDAPGWI